MTLAPAAAALLRAAACISQALLVGALPGQSSRSAPPGAVVTRYGVVVHVMPADQRIAALAAVTVRNTDSVPRTDVPFLLYRLLVVNGVAGPDGDAAPFTQRVVAFADEPTLQVNALTVRLRHALAPGASAELRIRYGGAIFGYPEVMAYTKDHVGEDYTLLRPDVFAYPVLARPSFASLATTFDQTFDYDLQAIVPAEYGVATGGVLVQRQAIGDSLRYEYRSRRPVPRLDVAVAHFVERRDSAAALMVYTLVADTIGADTVLSAVKRASALYASWFGPPPVGMGYTVIEIPDGWGSQAAPGYLLQTAAAFHDPGAARQVYHEVAHAWNARAAPGVQRARWFDEAFASYFAALALGEFDGPAARDSEMAHLRARFLEQVAKDRRNATVPIAEYGAHDLGDDSYTKGAWSLYVLHRALGDTAFRHALRDLLAEYGSQPADFHSVEVIAERAAGHTLAPYFRDWIYGAESSTWLEQGVTVDEMARRAAGGS